MKKAFKKSLALFLAVVIVFGSAPISGLVGLDFGNLFGAEASAADHSVGDIIELGSYPQSEVTDSATLSALNSLSKTWVSYGYYSGTGERGSMVPGDWMKYADVTYHGSKYRAVTFTQNRPGFTEYSFSSSYSCQYDNGYSVNTTYWFKYEPLEWRVLDPTNGLVLCETIIDSQAFNNTIYDSFPNYYNNSSETVYANDYETSSIRAWLNVDFYDTAFIASEKAYIKTTALNNDAVSSSYSQYDSAPTNDKVFLLSNDDALNSAYGFSTSYSFCESREAYSSDYAKCQGLYSYWWLRTPGSNSDYACNVNNSSGNVYDHHIVNRTHIGVRPALSLNSELVNSEYSIVERTFYTNFDYYTEYWNSSSYNAKLSNMLAAMSAAVYSLSDIKKAYKSLGFNSSALYDYDGSFAPDRCGYSMAFKQSDYSDKTICLIAVRGSSNYSDWVGNVALAAFEDEKHIGFAYPANHIYANIHNKLPEGTDIGDIEFVITGHSRGAAVANLLAVKLMENGVSSENVYNYNFACPDVACKTSFESYNSIFNLCNREDIVPFVPGSLASSFTILGTSWNKFGRTYWFTKDAEGTISPLDDHNIWLYLDFFDKQKNPEDWGESFWDRLSDLEHAFWGLITKVFCPVDVIIKDGDGNKVASVIDGIIDYYNGSFGDVIILTDGDKKVIFIEEGKDFTAEMIGADSGEMTFAVEKCNLSTGEIDESKTFSNVKLEKDKLMTSTVQSNDDFENIELLVADRIDDYAIPTHNVDTSGNETTLDTCELKFAHDSGETYLDFYFPIGKAIPNVAPPNKSGYIFTGWTPSVPSTMPANDLTLTAVFERISIAIKGRNNSASINYGDTLRLTAVANMAAGSRVVWSVQGSGVSINASADGTTCDVTSTASGTVTVTAKIVDAAGNPITDADDNEISATQQIKSNAGFFQKLIAFFKNLFGASRIITQAFKEF